jgi:hypothetical protein
MSLKDVALQGFEVEAIQNSDESSPLPYPHSDPEQPFHARLSNVQLITSNALSLNQTPLFSKLHTISPNSNPNSTPPRPPPKAKIHPNPRDALSNLAIPPIAMLTRSITLFHTSHRCPSNTTSFHPLICMASFFIPTGKGRSAKNRIVLKNLLRGNRVMSNMSISIFFHGSWISVGGLNFRMS